TITSSVIQRLEKSFSGAEMHRFVAELLDRVEDPSGRYYVLRAAERYVSDEAVLDGLRSGDKKLFDVAAGIAGRRKLLDAWPLLLDQVQANSIASVWLERIEHYYLGLRKFHEVKRSVEEGATAGDKARKLARSESADQRRAAAYALGALGDPSAISLLLDLVTDPDEKVRAAAMGALERLGGAPEETGKEKGR
ncbi:MAG: HEAT repeat domain-containing protein, partial [Planctomycetota bacterium]